MAFLNNKCTNKIENEKKWHENTIVYTHSVACNSAIFQCEYMKNKLKRTNDIKWNFACK